MVRAFLEGGGNPILNLASGGALGDGLPVFGAHLGVGEYTDHRRPQPCSNFHPLLDVFDAFIADSLISGCEVIAHSGSADSDAEVRGPLLEPIDISVRRQLRVAGEVIPGGIEAFELILGGELENLHKGNSLCAAPDVV